MHWIIPPESESPKDKHAQQGALRHEVRGDKALCGHLGEASMGKGSTWTESSLGTQ